ncbi:MAG: hypothetical protein J5855_10740 [Mailhella sp.]|nr:hypothetical protein [Mailhella sp.]
MLFNRCPSASLQRYHFCTAGFCDGFTTFPRESLFLLLSGSYRAFLFCSLGSLMLGIAAFLAGYVMAR